MSAATTTAPPKPPPTGPPPRPNTNGAPPAQRATGTGTGQGQTRKNSNAGNPNVKVEPTAPPDPVTMYESVRSRIAVLEEEEVTVEEEERRLAEEARQTVRGAPDSVVQTKYIELFQEMKRLEREHAKEKQKLTKDKDAAKTQYNKASQARAKLESLARELQKDNKKLREDTRRLTISFEEARDEINQVKDELVQRQLARPSFFARHVVPLHPRKPLQENGAQQSADIVVKFVPEDEAEAARAVEELLDGVVRERLKDVLRQYERRERHFEAVVRSKELEVLLARARVEEQKGCVEVARRMARAAEQQNAALQMELEEMQRQEAALAEKIQQCLQALGKSSLVDPAPAAARIVRDVLREHLEMRTRTIEQNANQTSGDDAS
ncbi:hypothetical protein FRC06_002747 [Ceratobasidium sp. 370]|nr:hypothetical protein FRC06_002747 [Ceratobasidium sp. 370]